MLAARELHPLVGVKNAYYLNMQEPVSSLPWWRRWLVRAVYFGFDWWGKFYSVHDMGIFTDRDVAEAVAAQKRKETGKAWSVKELPVNAILGEEAVRYGFYSFPGSDADYRYRNRIKSLPVVKREDIDLLEDLDREVDRLIESARAG